MWPCETGSACILRASAHEYAGELYISTESVCFVFLDSVEAEPGVPRQFVIPFTSITGVRQAPEDAKSLCVLIRTDQYHFFDLENAPSKVELLNQLWNKNLRGILKRWWQQAHSLHNIGSSGSGMTWPIGLLFTCLMFIVIVCMHCAYSSSGKKEAQDHLQAQVLLLRHSNLPLSGGRYRRCCFRYACLSLSVSLCLIHSLMSVRDARYSNLILAFADKCTLNLSMCHNSETEISGVFYLLKSFACFQAHEKTDDPGVMVVLTLPHVQLLKSERIVQMALPGCCSVCGECSTLGLTLTACRSHFP